MSGSSTLDTQKRTGKHTPKKERHPPPLQSREPPWFIKTRPSTICANLLLSYARQFIEQATTTTSSTRAPSIMTVVLGLRVEYDGDRLIELLQRRRQDVGSPSTDIVYTFKDEQSLTTCWTDQAAICGDMRTIDEGPSVRFPDSDERSTASWTAALNAGLSED